MSRQADASTDALSASYSRSKHSSDDGYSDNGTLNGDRRSYGYSSGSFDLDSYRYSSDGVDIDAMRERRTQQRDVASSSLMAEPMSPLFPATGHSMARMASAPSLHASQYSVPMATPVLPPSPSDAPTAMSASSVTSMPAPAPRGPLRTRRSVHESLSYLTETPIEEYVAKYQVIKCSWRGKYERILALGPTRFCTIDPKDFEVTNTWPLASLLNVDLEDNDPEGFTLFLKGVKKDEQLKLRCRFRSHLLSDLFRQVERSSGRPQRVQTQYSCAKWTRKGSNMDGLVEVGKDGLSFLRRDGSVRSTYLFVEMEHVSAVAGSNEGFVIGYGGRPRLFFSDRRNIVMGQITSAAEELGLSLPSRNGLTVASIQQERQQYGKDVGQKFVQFSVHKITRKYPMPMERTLSLHAKHLVEEDPDGGVVSCVPYNQMYVLVRSARNQTHFGIQLLNGAITMQYASSDRDGVLAAIYDLCVTCNESPELFITSVPNERGLRLIPCFATEDTAETHSFFGDTSIGICFLQRMTAVGKFGGSRKSSDRGFISIVEEFNANVPASGILYDTKQSIIVEALRPIGAQLYYISKGSPIASRSAVTLLQALFRISSSFYGFREVAQIPQLAEALANILMNGDEFAVFWTTLLLKRLTVHTPPPSVQLDGPSLRSSDEVETYNKSVLFGSVQLLQSLVAHLHGVDIKGTSPTAQARYRIGPLVLMGMLQTLEGCLCSKRVTTAPGEFQLIVAEVAKFYSTLLKILFQSRCATTVEACTLLLKAIVEECDPAVATQIRDAALGEGIVLRHFYQAVFDPSFDQRSVSRYLISLWMSHHPPSKQLLSRILPPGFLSLLDAPAASTAELQELDQLEREEGNGTMADGLHMSDDQLYGKEGWSTAPGNLDATVVEPGSGSNRERSSSYSHLFDAPPLPRTQGGVSTTFDNRASLLVAAASARESTSLQIENDYTKSRMLQKLQSSAVLSSSRNGRMLEDDRSSESSRGSKRASGGQANLEGSQRVRKRDIAYDFIANAISKSKTQRPHPTRIKRNSKNSAAAGHMRDDREPENFRLLFYTLGRDFERVDLIWNADTRVELKRAMLHEIQLFGMYQNSVASGKAVWNYEDFKVEYPSLRKELVVGGVYVRVLAGLLDAHSSREVTDEDTFRVLQADQVVVRDPQRLIERLYRRILRENVQSEYHSNLEMTLVCAQGLSIVAGAHANFAGSTELDEIAHLVQLMLDTIHVPVLEALLHVVRALVMARGNAKKLLVDESVIETMVSLLQLGHVTDRGQAIAPPKQVWRLEDGATSHDPVAVEDLREQLGSIDPHNSNCVVARCGDEVCEHAKTITSRPLLSILQLRWEVGIHGRLSPLQVAHNAIEVLLSIAHSNELLGNVGMRQSLFPVVRSKIVLWRRARDILPLLARYNSPQLCLKAAKLLNFLFEETAIQQHQQLGNGDDASHRSSLHLWGLFYMAFLVDTSNFEDFAGLLKSTHLHQDGFDGVSALVAILPDAMICKLEMLNPREFTQIFNGNISSPEVVWNRDMRLHLRDNCFAHMEDYLEYLQEDVQSHWRFCPMAPVTYSELENEVWCGRVYLSKFCETDKYIIQEPLVFMRSLSAKWRAEVDRKAALFSYEEAAALLGVTFQSTSRDVQTLYRSAFKRKARDLQQEDLEEEAYRYRVAALREAYRVVTCPRDSLLTAGHDPVRLLLILNSMIEMCNRYVSQLGLYEFDCYDLLLSLLHSHCTEEGTAPEFTTEEQRLDIAVRSAELLFQTCAVSARNADVLLKQQADLEVLEKVVRYCVDIMIAHGELRDSRLDKVCFFVLQTITGLLASQGGRMWISDTTTLIIDMARILWVWNQHSSDKQRRFVMAKITQQVLESISRMSMLKANQERMLQTGAAWQLVLFFMHYDVLLDETTVRSRLGITITSESEFDAIADEVQNLLAIMAVRALCRLGGFFSPESELACPRSESLGQAFEALLTPNLSRLLLLESHHEFLKIFHSDCASYTLHWNEAMRQEMLDFVRPRATPEPTALTREDYCEARSFRFEHLAKVFTIGDIYIDALIESLIVLQQKEVPPSMPDLGLTERFYLDAFAFVDNGKLRGPVSMSEANGTTESDDDHSSDSSPVSILPYSGWKLEQDALESTHRVTALHCLALVSEVIPSHVERYVTGDAQIIKMLLRLLFPPDNEVHQSDQGETKNLVFSLELYEPSRYHCLVILESLSPLNAFGRTSYEVGICDILVEVVNECRDVGPKVLTILRNLCRTSARADFVTDLLQSGTYIEFIGWLVGVEQVEMDEDRQLAEALRLPAAELLGEMAHQSGALSMESLTMLNRFFPATMTDQLVSEPHRFISFYQSDHEQPELVWNSAMREHLRKNILSLLSEYYTAIGTEEGEEERETLTTKVKSRLDKHVVDYASVYPEPIVGSVYVNLYIRNPTHKLRDPLFFVRCLWTEFETLYSDLSHLSSSLRDTRSPDDEMMTETAEKFLDLVTACLVCVIRTNPWILDTLAEARIAEKACGFLNDCVRQNLSEACSVAVVRLLRVMSTSRKCVATMQPMGSSVFSCLLSQMSRARGGELYRESAYTLEIIRRIIINFPSTITNGEGVVTVAMRVDLFNYLLNIVENPGVMGPVRQPNFARTIAIDILNTLEKDRIQARAAHDILKKNKKWGKKFRHEGMAIPIPASPEDPFLHHFSPEIDRLVTEYAANAPSSQRPTVSARAVFDPRAPSMRGTIMDRFRQQSPREQSHHSFGGAPRASFASSNGSSTSSAAPKKGINYKKLFNRRG